MISFTVAFEPVCSVYALSTMLTRVRNTWIIYYKKHIHVHYIQYGVNQLQNIMSYIICILYILYFDSKYTTHWKLIEYLIAVAIINQ